MTDSSRLNGRWLLTFARGGAPVEPGFHPLAQEWRNIAIRESRLGIPVGQPILVSDALVDYRLGDYFRMAFRADQRSTAETYAIELRVWLNFLDARRLCSWYDASHREVRAFQTWRVYSEDNPGRVAPSTWNKGLQALKHFYSWTTREGITDENPVLDRHELSARGGVGPHREKNARFSRDRWLTPLEYRLWRDVGLRGYAMVRAETGNLVPGQAASSSRSRNTARNTAFVDFGLTTGLRREELGTLLTFELPSAVDEEVPIVGKGNVYRHYRAVHRVGLESLADYFRGERRDAVRRGLKAGRYELSPDRLIAEVLDTRRGQHVRLADGRVLGLPGLPASERARLLIEGEQGIEPAWLWLSDAGVPLRPESWDDVFQAANHRVTAGRRAHGVQSPWVTVTPHSLRFTFALFVLLAGVRAIDTELGIGPAEPFFVRNYSQAFDEVRDLLGHSSTVTTRKHYLEPVKGLRTLKFLRAGSLTEMWDELRTSSPVVGFKGI